MISEFKYSGLSKTDYHKNNSIPVSTFNYWENRLKELKDESCGNRFVELKIPDTQTSAIRITDESFEPELGIYYQGLRILIYVHFIS